jgi:hypothetical protein
MRHPPTITHRSASWQASAAVACVFAVAGLLGPSAASAGTSAAGPQVSCGTLWSEVPAPTPTVPFAGPSLTGVAAVSSSDAWAVSAQGRIEHSDGGAWTLSPFKATGPLTGVSAASAKNVWAVGYTAPGGQTLTAHWDGSAWSVVPSPSVGVGENRLTAVDARGAHDVWAVGWYSNGAVHQTLIEHWDGSAWSVVASPNVASGDNELHGVTAIGGGDAWAVGLSGGPFSDTTLALHWDGTGWSVVHTPNPGTSSALLDIDATAPGDVWAVGQQTMGATIGPLLLRWNGSSWEDHSVVSVHAPAAVVAIGPSDAWAVGSQGGVLHWNGTSWSEVSTPQEGKGLLDGVAATSAGDVWAVGYSSQFASSFGLAEHFDGMAWTSQSTPVTRYAHDGELRAIAAVSPHNLWAVGDSRVQPDPLIEHWNGAAWSIVPGPSVGATRSDLRSASATSASDVWAAGAADNESLVEHFDGASWGVATVPNVGPIVAIAAISDHDVWAAGTAFFLHFDGTSWSSVPSPIAGLAGLAAIASDDVYAVGSGAVAHFDGTSWTIVLTPPGSHALSVIAASGPNDVWALGQGKASFHYNGVAWSRVPIPDTRQMTGGSAVDPGQAWATGSGHHASTVLRWDGTSWSTDLTTQRPAMVVSVVALSSGDVWAVGLRRTQHHHPYVLHGTVCGDQAPVVTAPVASPQPWSSVTNEPLSQVTVQVTWAGSDADDSIAAYHLEESVNGGSFAPVALSDPTNPAASIHTVLASTYVLRASATDSRGITGDWATAASFEPLENQYPTERVGWRSRTDPDDWRGSDFYTGRHGTVALLRFHGRAIAWVGAVGPGYGVADVFIGGVHVASVSQHSALSDHRLVLFSFVWPAYGRHAIRIVARGAPGHPRTSIDGYVVLQ